MMKKPGVIMGIILSAAGLGSGAYYWQNLRLAGPAVQRQPHDIAGLPEEGKGPGGGKYADPAAFPLKLPPGFAISIFAKKLPGARVLVLDPDGNLLVSLTSQGRVVALPDPNGDGAAAAVVTVLDGLNKPHGLAFGPGKNPGSMWRKPAGWRLSITTRNDLRPPASRKSPACLRAAAISPGL